MSVELYSIKVFENYIDVSGELDILLCVDIIKFFYIEGYTKIIPSDNLTFKLYKPERSDDKKEMPICNDCTYYKIIAEQACETSEKLEKKTNELSDLVKSYFPEKLPKENNTFMCDASDLIPGKTYY